MAEGNSRFEGELVVAIGLGGKLIAPERAPEHIFGCAAGVDLTCRDVQDEAKQVRNSRALAVHWQISSTGHHVFLP